MPPTFQRLLGYPLQYSTDTISKLLHQHKIYFAAVTGNFIFHFLNKTILLNKGYISFAVSINLTWILMNILLQRYIKFQIIIQNSLFVSIPSNIFKPNQPWTARNRETEDLIIFEPTRECCIYKVPESLREVNRKAYIPQMISLGPIRYYKRFETNTNNILKRYKQKFIDRTSKQLVERFEIYIETNRQRIRACYDDDYFVYRPDADMVGDIIFIFELFIRNNQKQREFDYLLDTSKIKSAVKRDLQVLEHQIPYFVFREMFLEIAESVCPAEQMLYSDPFLILALRFFFGDENVLSIDSQDLRHFTDLRRYYLLNKFQPQNGNSNTHITDMRCATKLQASGVEFAESDDFSVSCEYVKKGLKTQQLVLKIPHFEVDNDTECLIRNVMAFEQLHYPLETHVCSFFFLMGFLVDTQRDVDLLVEKGILSNVVGDHAAVVTMFNQLGIQVTPGFSCYADIGEKLKGHYEKRWNHTKASLKSVYFRDPWIATGTVVAAVLLLLTLVQTVCSVIQVL